MRSPQPPGGNRAAPYEIRSMLRFCRAPEIGSMLPFCRASCMHTARNKR
jgi:hypothetical protein